MAAIALQITSQAGLGPTYQAATGSDNVAGTPNDETVFIHALNTNAATATITINPVSPTTVKVVGVGPIAVPPISVVIPATTGSRMIGPISAAYVDATGNVTLLSTGVITNLTLAAIRLPKVSY